MTPTLTQPISCPPATRKLPNRKGGLLHHYMQLTKIRLTLMVLITTAVGFILASPGHILWGRFSWTLLGTFLAAAGASALNQLLEIDRDGRMERTRSRPLPAHTMSRTHALIFALITITAGVTILNELANPLTAALGLVNVLIYALVYTPLKSRTSLNTLVGAIVGALPPMMGWTGAVNQLDLGTWLLGTILFVWQVPHFLALAWMYRVDYARAGHRMLPVIEPSGRLTCLLIVLYTLALLPVGLAVSYFGIAGYLYAVGSLLFGLGFFILAFQLYFNKTQQHARRVFLASVSYLPLLLILMVLDARGPKETTHELTNQTKVTVTITSDARP